MNCRTIGFLITATLLVACTGKDDNGGQTAGETTTAADTTSGASMTTFTVTTAESMTTTAGESGGSEGTGGGSDETGGPTTGSSFILRPDGGGAQVECDVWAQDCPAGEKCMPWANDGGSSWNATKCTPVDANPGQVGDTCTVEGSGVSGIDTCDVAMMCYYVDAETNMGTCVAFCGGSMDNPLCDPGFVCTIVNDGVLILCRPECDPILQDCEIANTACLPANGTDEFTCIIDASGDAGIAGDPCEFINACDPGLFCADPTAVPNCAAAGCCSEFCDLTAPDPNAMCTQAGQECVAWHEMGMAPPGLEHVGACVIPM